MNMDTEILQVRLEDIIPNRFQPRLSFDEQGLQELADSIKEHGIIQPLVLRKMGAKYEIIAGERRYKAAGMAGLQTVPAVISNIDDNKSAEVAVVENLQRRNLSAIEEARSYKNLLDKGYLTQEALAKKMGVSQPSIANKLRLLNLDDEVQEALLEGKISERHARSLLTVSDKNEQKKWLSRILNERLTVRQLDSLLKNDSEEDIPLVNATPNINEIINNAQDIPQFTEPQKPEIETLDIGEEISDEPAPTKKPFKFFDDLENNAANMNIVDDTPSIFSNPILPPASDKQVEVLDFGTKSEPVTPEPIPEPTEKVAIDLDAPPIPEDKPSRFLNPDPVKTDDIFERPKEVVMDPMSVLDGIANENTKPEVLETVEAPKVSNESLDKIKALVEELKNTGVSITLDEIDFDDLIQLIIKINK